jgi:hypothetical protein
VVSSFVSLVVGIVWVGVLGVVIGVVWVGVWVVGVWAVVFSCLCTVLK